MLQILRQHVYSCYVADRLGCTPTPMRRMALLGTIPNNQPRRFRVEAPEGGASSDGRPIGLSRPHGSSTDSIALWRQKPGLAHGRIPGTIDRKRGRAMTFRNPHEFRMNEVERGCRCGEDGFGEE